MYKPEELDKLVIKFAKRESTFWEFEQFEEIIKEFSGISGSISRTELLKIVTGTVSNCIQNNVVRGHQFKDFIFYLNPDPFLKQFYEDRGIENTLFVGMLNILRHIQVKDNEKILVDLS